MIDGRAVGYSADPHQTLAFHLTTWNGDRHGSRLGYRVPARGAITDVAPPTEVASV